MSTIQDFTGYQPPGAPGAAIGGSGWRLNRRWFKWDYPHLQYLYHLALDAPVI